VIDRLSPLSFVIPLEKIEVIEGLLIRVKAIAFAGEVPTNTFCFYHPSARRA
jgi:hypothetical protein